MTNRVLLYVLTFALLLGVAHCARAAGATIEPDRPAFRAPADSSADTGAIRDHRWRVQAGACAVMQRRPPTHYLPTVNIDRRWTWLFSHESSGYAIGPLVEAGLNIIIPYAKAGIEMRVGGFFIDAHGGVSTGVIPEYGVFIFPIFYGGCTGYMFEVGGGRMELEAGINATDLDAPTAFPYATIGFSW